MHHSSVSREITLLYFLSWNFIWFLQKVPIKVPNFCWKYIKFQLKKYIGVMSLDTEEWYKIWRKNNLLFQKWQEFGEFWSKHSKVSKIFTSISPFCAKYITFDLKIQRSYLSWHWRVMENLKKDWLVVWKMTWGSWQIFIRTLESVTVGIFMGSFCPK